MRGLRSSYRLGPAGGGMLLVLVAAVVVLVAGPGHDRAPAAVILALIVFLLVVRPGGTKFAMARTLGERRDALSAPDRGPSAEAEESVERHRGAARASEPDEQPGGE